MRIFDFHTLLAFCNDQRFDTDRTRNQLLVSCLRERFHPIAAFKVQAILKAQVRFPGCSRIVRGGLIQMWIFVRCEHTLHVPAVSADLPRKIGDLRR